jgi:hypothetical protein
MLHKLLILCLVVFIHLDTFAQESNETTAITPGIQVLSQDINQPVPCFEKLEIGVPLPAVIRQKVNHFVKGTGGSSKQLNPYLDWELRVFAEFTNQNAPSEKIIIDGFYTKEFQAWGLDPLPEPKNKDDYTHDEYRKIGGYKEENTLFDFRIRFAPPTEGQWSVVVKIAEKNQEVHSYPSITFQATKGSKNGYIHVSPNQRFLAKDGETFYPIGCNLPWPETDTIVDPELFNNISYYDHRRKVYCRMNEGYLPIYVSPRVYAAYRNSMRKLADNGANYLRTIMYPSSTDIEWEEAGNYTGRLAMAQEMDEILETAEQNGIFLHWNMQIHYSFQFTEKAYYRTWAWDSNINGEEFAYKKLIQSDNPVDFFQNETAKKYYKQRLRYILSRWGYSTNIAVWELFSEITNVGSPKADNNDFYMQGDNYKIYRDWQIEMAKYMKSHYYGEIHLITASYGGPKNPKDDTFHHPAFDIITSNIYDFGAPDFSTFWNSTAAKHYLHDVPDPKEYFESYTTNAEKFGTENYQIRKPMIYSETDPIEAMCDPTIVELRRSMWQSMFSGLAGSLSWDLRFHPKYYEQLKLMDAFISKIDLNSEGWHPGTIENKEGNWVYSSDWSKEMNPKKRIKGFKGQKTSLADVAFLRSYDKNFAIGVITNKTYNVNTVSNCFPETNWPSDYESLNEQMTVSLKTDGASLPGMNRGKYDFQYFLLSNPENPAGKSSDRGPDLKMDFTVPVNDADFVVLFLANKKNYDWKLKRKLSKEEIKQMRSK